MKRLLTALLTLGAPLLLWANQDTDNIPAFLDDFNQITVWTPQPHTLQDLQSKVQVRIGDSPVQVTKITPREKATSPIEKGQVVLPGSIQAALGASEWDPNGQITKMTSVAPGVYEFVARFPAGTYEYKVAVNGSWEENYGRDLEPGGPNIFLTVPADNTIVRFQVDFNKKTIQDSINNPSLTPPTTVQQPKPTNPNEGEFQSFGIQLARNFTRRELWNLIEIKVNNGPWRQVIGREVFNNEEFQYTKTDLGPTYTPTSTTFKVWSPAASFAYLALFDSPTGPMTKRIPMKLGANGVWYIKEPGDLHKTYYQFQFMSYGEWRTTADIYAPAANRDSTRSMVVDLRQTNPSSWPAKAPFQSPHQTDAIIYEAHIRDLTVTANVPTAHKGKYLGLTHDRPNTPLRHIKNLGVTHLHLLPFQNFNPAHSNQYNWGYETTLFNVPEEQYSTDPTNPLTTIRETKQMIAALQNNGIGVILDVVYNHSVPSQGPDSAFWQTMPYYYFRTNDKGDVLNESGVGNALHDDRPMVRKFIRDSLIFWTKEYNLDGFRFDLIGMFTPETNRDLAQAIHQAKPNMVVYGEPWTGGGPNRSPKGAQKNAGYAVFNDTFRNFLRGGLDEAGLGYIDGAPLQDRLTFQNTLKGSLELFTASPQETINYVSAHDNLTLWDTITMSRPDADLESQKRSLKLAGSLVLLSQGVPFLEGGAEIGRTKNGNHNSYNAGDLVNRYDWQRATLFKDVEAYYQDLIALRKAHPAFRLHSADQINQAMSFVAWPDLPENTIAYTLDGTKTNDPWKKILVIFHNGLQPTTITLPPGSWKVGLHDELRRNQTAPQTTQLFPLSTTVLYQN